MKHRTRKEIDKPPFDLRDLIKYNPQTGDITWTITRGRAIAGERTGASYPGGVPRVQYRGRQYPVDLLAWWLVTGDWLPAYRHKWVDGSRENNRASNLSRFSMQNKRELLSELIPDKLPETVVLAPAGKRPIAWHSIRQGDLLELLGELVGGLTVEEIAGYWREKHGATSNSYVLRALRGLEKRQAVRMVDGRVYCGIPEYLK